MGFGEPSAERTAEVLDEDQQVERIGGGACEPEALVEACSRGVASVHEHRPGADEIGGLQRSDSCIGHESASESMPLERAVDSETSKDDDSDRVGRHAFGVPLWEVKAVDRSRRQRVVPGHASLVCEYVCAGSPRGRSDEREPGQPVVEVWRAAVEVAHPMLARQRSDREIAQGLIN